MAYSLLNINYENGFIESKVSVFLILAVLLFGAFLWLLAKRRIFTRHSDVELEIKLGKIGKIKIKPNYEVRQIAHKAWVELKTRKAGLPIDKKNDVIADVYKSWYELFREIRELARDVPASQLKDKDTQELIRLLIDSLNDGLRPHLTRWQAKYSRWYQKALDQKKYDRLTPQQLQASFPQYQELVDDMLTINGQLVQYTDEIKKLAV